MLTFVNWISSCHLPRSIRALKHSEQLHGLVLVVVWVAVVVVVAVVVIVVEIIKGIVLLLSDRWIYCVVCVRLTGCVGSSLLAVGIFSFNKLTWNWSVSAEVFGLNNLFTALLMSSVVDIDTLAPEHYQQMPKVCLQALLSLISSLGLLFCWSRSWFLNYYVSLL